MVVALPKPGVVDPPPAMVVMMLVMASTRRTVREPLSTTYRLPEGSRAMRRGSENCAASASPPSPPGLQKPGTPATVVMMFVVAATLRTTQLKMSPMYTLPEGSTATPSGEASEALVAGPPSPSKPKPAQPRPAKFAITPVPRSTWRTRLLSMSAM